VRGALPPSPYLCTAWCLSTGATIASVYPIIHVYCTVSFAVRMCVCVCVCVLTRVSNTVYAFTVISLNGRSVFNTRFEGLSIKIHLWF
jgi:hypothetical protein